MQIKLEFKEEYMKLLRENCQANGYRYPAQFAEKLIIYALKSGQFDVQEQDTKSLENYQKIGESARKMAGRKFSIARAVDDHEETVNGYKKALKKGWIKQEHYDSLIKESEMEHKKNVRLELEKKELTKTIREKSKDYFDRCSEMGCDISELRNGKKCSRRWNNFPEKCIRLDKINKNEY